MQLVAITIGFSVSQKDVERLRRLVEKYGGGNRSAFLRAAMDLMDSETRAEEFREFQAYGSRKAAERGLQLSDVQRVIDEVRGKRRRRT